MGNMYSKNAVGEWVSALINKEKCHEGVRARAGEGGRKHPRVLAWVTGQRAPPCSVLASEGGGGAGLGEWEEQLGVWFRQVEYNPSRDSYRHIERQQGWKRIGNLFWIWNLEQVL